MNELAEKGRDGGLTTADEKELESYRDVGHLLAMLRSKARASLFPPRKDKWAEHFYWDRAILRAHTAIGRVTIDVLRINDPEYVAVRAALVEEGVFPPPSRSN